MLADRDSLSSFIGRREWEYGLAVLRCPQMCDSRPVGVRRLAGRALSNGPFSRGDSIDSAFGGYGLYYRSPQILRRRYPSESHRQWGGRTVDTEQANEGTRMSLWRVRITMPADPASQEWLAAALAGHRVLAVLPSSDGSDPTGEVIIYLARDDNLGTLLSDLHMISRQVYVSSVSEPPQLPEGLDVRHRRAEPAGPAVTPASMPGLGPSLQRLQPVHEESVDLIGPLLLDPVTAPGEDMAAP